MYDSMCSCQQSQLLHFKKCNKNKNKRRQETWILCNCLPSYKDDRTCLEACPTGALVKRKGGVLLNKDMCTGCRKCVDACIVGAVFFDEEEICNNLQAPDPTDSVHIMSYNGEVDDVL